MKIFTIDDAIADFEQAARRCGLNNMDGSYQNNKQIADWLRELKMWRMGVKPSPAENTGITANWRQNF